MSTTSDFGREFHRAVGAGLTIVPAPRPVDETLAFARSVAAGLSRRPRRLDFRYLYDAEGSRLFEEITKQPEYYLTRTEEALLAQYGPTIRALTGPCTLLELGSGFSVKTEHLLAAYDSPRHPLLYVPIDVSSVALREASENVGSRFPRVRFAGVHGPYESVLSLLRDLSPQMVVFLGSSLGNLDEEEDRTFWQDLARHLPTGDFFLLGVDLKKERALLDAAYDDAAGVTARFSRNYFARMNRELEAELVPEEIDHSARYNARRGRVEIHARFARAQRLNVAPLGLSFPIQRGERLLLEISRKYSLPTLVRSAKAHGFALRARFLDERRWFALLLLERTAEAPSGTSGASRA